MSENVHALSYFEWTNYPHPTQVSDGGDGYCVRDAVCQLLGWPVGSPEWKWFRESPAPGDDKRLYDHLGLTIYDIAIPEHWNELITKTANPGIASFALPRIHAGHAVYVPRVFDVLVRWHRPEGLPLPVRPGYGYPLGPQYMNFDPRLFWIILNDR